MTFHPRRVCSRRRYLSRRPGLRLRRREFVFAVRFRQMPEVGHDPQYVRPYQLTIRTGQSSVSLHCRRCHHDCVRCARVPALSRVTFTASTAPHLRGRRVDAPTRYGVCDELSLLALECPIMACLQGKNIIHLYIRMLGTWPLTSCCGCGEVGADSC